MPGNRIHYFHFTNTQKKIKLAQRLANCHGKRIRRERIVTNTGKEISKRKGPKGKEDACAQVFDINQLK